MNAVSAVVSNTVVENDEDTLLHTHLVSDTKPERQKYILECDYLATYNAVLLAVADRHPSRDH